MKDPIILVESFRKLYGKFVAVDGISFNVQRGEIFGLLGPNGAGKTSILESLEGLRCPDSGSVKIMGIDPVRQSGKIRNIIGVQLQSSGLPGSMRVEEAMRFFCAYHRVSPRYDLLDRLGLAEKRGAQYHMLSIGQQRRLSLALAMAHNLPVVFLDEPTAGLDVHSRVELHNLMHELKAADTTIVLATHDMAEAEKMADRVAILLNGKIVASGTPRELTATGSKWTKVTVSTEGSCLLQSGVSFPAVIQHVINDEYAVYYSNNIGLTVPAIISHIDTQGDVIVDLRVERPSLEERFLEITNDGGF